MAGLSKAIIIGNLGRDPEMRYTPTGKPVTSFSVACSRTYTTAEGERREETEWFRISAWGKLAEISSQYLRKGSKVYVEGRLRTRQWEGQDGQKRTSVEIDATDLQMLDTKARGESGDTGADESGSVDVDQIPF
jgi:single-strand DNA-binding protein